MIKRSGEFKQEAVRIALTSGLPRERTASNLKYRDYVRSADHAVLTSNDNPALKGQQIAIMGPAVELL